jgi:hypothetical protein
MDCFFSAAAVAARRRFSTSGTEMWIPWWYIRARMLLTVAAKTLRKGSLRVTASAHANFREAKSYSRIQPGSALFHHGSSNIKQLALHLLPTTQFEREEFLPALVIFWRLAVWQEAVDALGCEEGDACADCGEGDGSGRSCEVEVD